MPPRAHSARRVVELGAVAAVIALPIALIAATWSPHEPPPRGGRARTGNEISVPATDRGRTDAAHDPGKARTRSARKAKPADP